MVEKHVYMVGGALRRIPPVYCVDQGTVDTLHDRIGIIVIISEERCFVPDKLPQLFMLFPVVPQCVEETVHGKSPFFVDMLPEDGKTISYGPYTAALNLVFIVAGTAVVVVLPVLNAVVDEHREIGCRCKALRTYAVCNYRTVFIYTT